MAPSQLTSLYCLQTCEFKCFLKEPVATSEGKACISIPVNTNVFKKLLIVKNMPLTDSAK